MELIKAMPKYYTRFISLSVMVNFTCLLKLSLCYMQHLQASIELDFL